MGNDYLPLGSFQRGGFARGKTVTTSAGNWEVSRSLDYRDELGDRNIVIWRSMDEKKTMGQTHND